MGDKKHKLVMKGAVGIRKDFVDDARLADYRERLTVQTVPFKDNPVLDVEGYIEDDDYLWVPRYFDKLALWPSIDSWNWVTPHLDYELFHLMTPCPKRKQPEAIAALVSVLKRDSACIGVLPTGLGKTLTSLEVARQFQTPIGIFVYAGHMIDNWVEHAQMHLGIPREDIGIIKENKCDIGKPLTIISIQTVLSRDLPREATHQFGFLIADECLTGDALITTNVGNVEISNIPDSGATHALCYNEHKGEWEWKKIRRWIDQGVKQTVTVLTSEGPSLRCTPNHPLLTKNGWKTAGDLQPEDKILSPRRASAGAKYPLLPSMPEAASANSLSAVGCLTPRLTGLRESKSLMTEHLYVNVAEENSSRFERILRKHASKIISGRTTFEDITELSLTDLLLKRVSPASYMAHCLETVTFFQIRELRQILESVLTTAPRRSNGHATKRAGSTVFISGRLKLTTQDSETSLSGIPASPTPLSLRCIGSSGYPRSLLRSGSVISQTKAGPGGIWTTARVKGEVSDFIQKALTSKVLRLSQTSFQTNSEFVQLSRPLSPNIGSFDSESQTQSSGCSALDSSLPQEWDTSFLTVMKVVEDLTPGDRVYDLEIEDNHNFVANGLLVHNCHRYGAAAWSRVAAQFPARYRLGMSASPIRDDGLDPIIRWNFGKVGYAIHQRPTGELPLVCLVRYPAQYQDSKYLDWRRIKGRNGRDKWIPGSPNPMKYDKLLSQDTGRNAWLVGKMIEARAKNRSILVFARHRDHIQALHTEFGKRYAVLRSTTNYPETHAALLWGGIKDKERKEACGADLIFTTHSYAREALNLTHLDTLIFATPAGDPLQPAGRLRDKGTGERQSLLIVDPFEPNNYSFKKALKRKATYEGLGMKTKRLKAK